MADRGEDEDLQMAIRMSMQHGTPEPKRSKPRDAVAGVVSDSPEDSPESKTPATGAHGLRAAEKRMAATARVSPSPSATRPQVKGGRRLVKFVTREEELRLQGRERE
ncbi:Ubiquitin interacting motif [Sesbania bispinosa]|nr:Ubiquitin interacting motif [Sesbania bispinosa]